MAELSVGEKTTLRRLMAAQGVSDGMCLVVSPHERIAGWGIFIGPGRSFSRREPVTVEDQRILYCFADNLRKKGMVRFGESNTLQTVVLSKEGEAASLEATNVIMLHERRELA